MVLSADLGTLEQRVSKLEEKRARLSGNWGDGLGPITFEALNTLEILDCIGVGMTLPH